MQQEMLSPANTTIVLIDYAIGFADVMRSHDLKTHLNNVTAFAKVGVSWNAGLVITSGVETKPTGPMYPDVEAVIGDRPVIERPANYNAFLDPNFKAAVKAAGRPNVVVGGISTEGCVLQTVLGGLREGYEMYFAEDCCASISKESHDMAVLRLTQNGATPVTWFSLSGEFLFDQTDKEASKTHQDITKAHVPEMAMSSALFFAAQDLVREGKA